MGAYFMWKKFEKHQRLFEVLFWVSSAATSAWVNAASVIADYKRISEPIARWEPWTWELSSQGVILALIPLVIWFNRRLPLYPARFVPNVFYHLLFSTVFTFLHVAGMVATRKIVYTFMERSYEFGNWMSEFVYEYRKDVFDYIWILVIIYAYRFIVSRLRGEAHVIPTGEDTPEPEYPERLLIKKLGKEFIIRVEDIDWVEAAGNYMNLHVGDRVYPLRETMNGLERRLDKKQFLRIHRSNIVNMDRIGEIIPLESGDCRVRMQNGHELNLSRRYRERVRDHLSM